MLDKDETTRDHTGQMTRYETLQIILTAFLLFAAIVAACIYGCQLSEMQKSTAATAKAAKAAEDSVNFARENSRVDQRPWVTVAVAALLRPLAIGEKPIVGIDCHNSGRTPALDGQIIGRLLIKDELTGADLAEVPVTHGDVSKMVFGPDGNGNGVCEAANPLTNTQLDSIQKGEMTLFLIGKILYADVFEEKHETSFCFFIKGRSLDRGVLGAYRTGNAVK